MNTITQLDVAARLRLDETTNELHWIKPRRGVTRAGWDVVNKQGHIVRRTIRFANVQYDAEALKALLLTGSMPTATKKPRRSKKGRKVVLAMDPAPVAEVPAELPELSRAVVAAAKPAHRGWLAGLGLRRAA